jgi:hypothetical protein
VPVPAAVGATAKLTVVACELSCAAIERMPAAKPAVIDVAVSLVPSTLNVTLPFGGAEPPPPPLGEEGEVPVELGAVELPPQATAAINIRSTGTRRSHMGPILRTGHTARVGAMVAPIESVRVHLAMRQTGTETVIRLRPGSLPPGKVEIATFCTRRFHGMLMRERRDAARNEESRADSCGARCAAVQPVIRLPQACPA